MNIFIDFAETIGYRRKPEIETDLDIVKQCLRTPDRALEHKYKSYCTRSNIYDRKLSFSSFNDEFSKTVEHFCGFLKDYLSIPDFESQAMKMSTVKYSTLVHDLYPDVLPALSNYNKHGSIYILSDGRPSRRKTLDLLGLDKLTNGYFISDEVGCLKSDSNFYLSILDKVCDADKTYFLDDVVLNIDAFSSVHKIAGVLIDRKRVHKPSQVKYRLEYMLPIEL